MNVIRFILLLKLLTVNALKYNNLIDTVIDFVKYRDNPTKINLLLKCWPSHNIKTFYERLSENSILTNVITAEYQEIAIAQELEMFIMDFECYDGLGFFNKKNEQLLQFPRRWFILMDDISKFPSNLPLWINTRVYLFQKQYPNVLTSPYQILHTNFYRYNDISTWANGSYSLPIRDISEYQHRINQHGLVINSTGVSVFPRTLDHLLDYRHLDEDSITKHNYLLLVHLMDIMNTKLNISWAPGWGTKAPNGTRYSLLMGDLQSGSADIGGTLGFITNDRFSFADYVANPLPTVGKFILRSPPLSAIDNILTMPFELDVWISMAVLILLIIVLMIVTVKLEWKFIDLNNDQENIEILRPNAADVIQFQIGVVCQQGIEKEPKSWSGKMITFCALLSFLFFYTSYSACIVALLQSSSSSITTLEDLLQTNIKLAADDMPYTKFFFARQKGKVKEAIFKTKIFSPGKFDNFLHADIAVEKMRTEFFAYHSERDTIYKQISKTFQEHEKCGLVEIKFLSEIEPYLIIRKKLPYKQIITMAYSRFKECGLSMRMYKRTYAEKPKCTGSGGSFRSVGINDAYFAVMLYAIGIVASILIYVIEKIFNMANAKEKLQYID